MKTEPSARPRHALPGLLVVAAWLLPVLVLAPALVPASEQSAVVGRAEVVDGDSLLVGAVKVRLFGIDAPEVGQYCEGSDGSRWPCGQHATVALDRLAGGRAVSCEVKDTDSWGRKVCVCKLGDGRDLSEAMVTAGWALAYRRFSNDYVDDETRAESRGVGIWRGSMVPPWKWRADRRGH
ncbi:MAG: thermonuclease family protein [Proteobacteria bacterium]|nr:thermonuclease family protein [Pseudomonadota bacterium]